jgi:hypothetical protein
MDTLGTVHACIPCSAVLGEAGAPAGAARVTAVAPPPCPPPSLPAGFPVCFPVFWCLLGSECLLQIKWQ